MRFLVDQNLSPALAEALTRAGHESVHVRDRGLKRADDSSVMALAVDEDRAVISADTDFGELLARSDATGPSVLMLRRQPTHRASAVAALILANLDLISDDLSAGAMVVLDGDRIRIRRLPMGGT
jgi:predicted nuclease of predicted toxin-antitoxin system